MTHLLVEILYIEIFDLLHSIYPFYNIPTSKGIPIYSPNFDLLFADVVVLTTTLLVCADDWIVCAFVVWAWVTGVVLVVGEGVVCVVGCVLAWVTLLAERLVVLIVVESVTACVTTCVAAVVVWVVMVEADAGCVSVGVAHVAVVVDCVEAVVAPFCAGAWILTTGAWLLAISAWLTTKKLCVLCGCGS